MSKVQMRALNVQVGQRIKVHSINYKGLTGEFDIIGSLPDGKYEGVSFMNIEYLFKGWMLTNASTARSTRWPTSAST